MATLKDDEFLAEVSNLIDGKPNDLVKPAAATPPVETPAPVVETPPVETPPVETPPVETPPVETPPVETPPAEIVETPPAKTPEEIAAEEAAAAQPDYKAAYERIFGAPIRAGGQDITLQNADEVISLVQKGVGFHNKMNRLQGDLKYVEMLRNNGLLDESKLSLLIDAQSGKPGAIKKLLDSAKIDPLTLDSAEASTYAPSDHRVTDEQVRFQTTVSDLSDSEAGREILQDAKGWDQASKAELYKAPETLGFLAQQKDMGRYDLIKAQVSREKILGNIPLNESFLTAYARVGQQMMQAGAFGKLTVIPPTPTPVTQKTITPAAPANPEKVAAAAPTRRSTPAPAAPVDTKEMNDGEFEKFFKKTFKI